MPGRCWTLLIALLVVAGDGPAQVRGLDLASRAEERGTLRVIVRLALPDEAEGAAPRSAGPRRAAIASAQEALLAQLGERAGRRIRRLERLPFIALEASPAGIAALGNSPWVAGLEEDRLLAPVLAESIPLIEGERPLAFGLDGTGHAVAVVDTGVDLDHAFLEGAVVAEACFSALSDCPNGQTSQIGPGAGVHCTYANSCDHGTHVAGIALGEGTTLRGVAPGASLAAVQVFSRFSGSDCTGQNENPCALAYVSDIVAGLEFVLDLGETIDVAAVNLSVGGGRWYSQQACDLDNPSLAEAFAELRAAGIAPVVSSGNEGWIDSTGAPACVTGAVSVGATDDSDAIADFSNSAPWLSLLAPGFAIRSSVPSAAPAANFEVWNGTSMAAPHVSGTWAILKMFQPELDVDLALAVLQHSGLPITDVNDVTASRIRVWPAVTTVPVGPECGDGWDNDGDGWIDHPDDPECPDYDHDDESRPPVVEEPLHCGLGIELALVLPPLLWLRRGATALRPRRPGRR